MPSDTAKRVRNTVVGIPGLQSLIKVAIRFKLLPNAVSSRLQPLGSHWISAPDGIPFRYVSDPSDVLARSFVWRGFGTWEATTVPVFYELARGARAFLDIGAYSGIYTLLACTANERLRAVAFEPNPHAFCLLERNVEVNALTNRVVLERVAASDHSGQAILRIPDDETAASILEGSGVPISVSVALVDDVIPAELDVDLVKIDVEGFETDVLKGMRRILIHNQPSVIVECLTYEAFATVRAHLRLHGYERFAYFGPHGLESAYGTIEVLPRYANFLCQP